MDKVPDNNQEITHKHSKLLLVITVVVLLIGAGIIIYFVNDTNKNKATTPAVEVVEPAEEKTVTSGNTLASAKDELNSVDIQELKLAVAELKTALAAFSQ